MSYPGTYKDTQGQLYGIRSSAPSVGSACVEYKCSGPLYTQVDTDITILDINIKDSSSKLVGLYLLRKVKVKIMSSLPKSRLTQH